MSGVALVGCGYVCDAYLHCLSFYPELSLVGVYDRVSERATVVAEECGLRAFESLAELLADESVDWVVNLTNPASHAEVTRACLEAGKHVYSEKPLALDLTEARQLLELARERGLQLASAPCNVLNEAAQTALKLVREGQLGKIRLAYAELDDGPVYLEAYRSWRNRFGVAWPHEDEFRVGCVMEHAGYALTWLVALLGPAHSISADSACLVPEKIVEAAPDFGVGVLHFAGGVAARVTCSVVAPRQRGLQLIGDEAVLSVNDLWNDGASLTLQTRKPLRRWLRERGRGLDLRRADEPENVPLLTPARATGLSNNMDFARGLIDSRRRQPCRLGGDFALHVLECTLALRDGQRRSLATTCLPWPGISSSAP